MTSSDWWHVAAVLLSPLIAVQVSVWLQNRRERRQQKVSIFKTLMSTRASALSPEHVSALNLIDIEFYGKGKKSQGVRTAWKAYLDHLNTGASPEVWNEKQQDLLVELLYQMAVALGYEFDKTDIKRASYFPSGYGEMQLDNFKIRKGLVGLVEGKSALQVAAALPEPPASSTVETQDGS
ncbi:MAG: hypothetical protein HY914_19125 [Desulfomonile tiedjei]|nr:hypothetical protein [Desulfomonile tiedjei]